MPFAGFTLWGRKSVSSVGSFESCGVRKRLAPRRFRLLCFECFLFGTAMSDPSFGYRFLEAVKYMKSGHSKLAAWRVKI